MKQIMERFIAILTARRAARNFCHLLHVVKVWRTPAAQRSRCHSWAYWQSRSRFALGLRMYFAIWFFRQGGPSMTFGWQSHCDLPEALHRGR